LGTIGPLLGLFNLEDGYLDQSAVNSSQSWRKGFTDINFVKAHTVNKEGRPYPIFLVTAVKNA